MKHPVPTDVCPVRCGGLTDLCTEVSHSCCGSNWPDTAPVLAGLPYRAVWGVWVWRRKSYNRADTVGAILLELTCSADCDGFVPPPLNGIIHKGNPETQK